MKLGALGFVPRPRRPLEALDLGLSLLQVHWRQVAGMWALQLGFAMALLSPFLWRTPMWMLLWLWWLKPWLDRGVLFVLSRAVFGQTATIWDFLREWRSVHRHGLVAGLLWRRFSPARSYMLPVFQLEGLGGSAYRNRTRVLARQGWGAGFLLTCSGWVFTVLTLIGVLPLLQAMVPPGTHFSIWNGFSNFTLGFQWFLVFVGLFALTLTEPFFVTAGFGLYLNRRTQLEGWDLELAFRRLASRLVLVLLLVFCAMPAAAQTPPPVSNPTTQEEGDNTPPPQLDGPLRPEEEARRRAQKILNEDPAFKRTEEVRKLRYKPTGKEPRWLRGILDALFGEKEQTYTPERRFPEGLAELIALLGKVLLVGGILAFVLWLIYRFHHRLMGPSTKDETWESPDAVAGLDIRPESLPPNVPAAARRLFQRGQARAAMALLYRGALAELVHRRGMEIPTSATEGDCLQAAKGRLEPGPDSTFRLLTITWQRLAYKDEAPDSEAFEALCVAWPAAFGGRP